MYRRITASCIILFMLFSGFRNEDLERTGFLGKSVTLPSGVTEPGTIIIIEWSIFTNQTYIAVFSGGHVNVPNSPRMELNKITGDLLIRDLRKEDSGTYTVRVRNTQGRRWVNKVTLSVQEELPEPKITVINSTVQHGMCNIFLMCSLKSKNTVTITYGPEGFPHGCEFKPLRSVTMGREAEAWCNPTQDVNITCTASDSVSTTASTVTMGCLGKGNISGFRNEDLERTGFLGKSVTLPSGVTEPGNITIIEWSIFTNQTYIAVFSGDHVNVPNSPRMELNKITGDLLIRDLRNEDSGTYTVRVRNTQGRRWVNKVTLSVQDPCSKCPTHLGVRIIMIIIIIILCFILMYIKRDALYEFARTSWERLTEWLPFLAQRSDDEDDSNHMNMVPTEEAPGQVSTDQESQRLQICDEVIIKDNNVAPPEEESSKKKENCDDTQPKEAA